MSSKNATRVPRLHLQGLSVGGIAASKRKGEAIRFMNRSEIFGVSIELLASVFGVQSKSGLSSDSYPKSAVSPRILTFGYVSVNNVAGFESVRYFESTSVLFGKTVLICHCSLSNSMTFGSNQ